MKAEIVLNNERWQRGTVIFNDSDADVTIRIRRDGEPYFGGSIKKINITESEKTDLHGRKIYEANGIPFVIFSLSGSVSSRAIFGIDKPEHDSVFATKDAKHLTYLARRHPAFVWCRRDFRG